MIHISARCSRSRLLRTSAMLLIVSGCTFNVGAAVAQDANSNMVAIPAREPMASDASAGEIVVTASRREERLSKVPISVTALGREKMDVQGIRQVQDIVSLTPGISFSQNTGYNTANSTVSIRGIVSRAGAATTGVYIDDTPIQAIGSLENFLGSAFPKVFDLERVEVLRGPQGTLFGGGAEGGVVRFITPKPSLTDYSGYARAEVSTTQGGDPSYEAGGAFGGPIVTDKIGFRASAWFRRDGGYTDRAPYTLSGQVDSNRDWQTSLVLRGALTFAPTEALTITPAITYQRNHINDQSIYWPSLSDAGNGKFVRGNAVAVPVTDRFYLPTLTIDYDLSGVKFTSVSSYFNRQGKTPYDLSNVYQAILLPAFFGLPANYFPTSSAGAYFDRSNAYVRQKVITQEARLQSADADARLRWVAGIFYQNMRQVNGEAGESPFFIQSLQAAGADTTGFDPINGVSLITVLERYRLEQIAGFLNLDFRIVDRLTLTAGGRVTKSTLKYLNRSDGPLNGGLSVAQGRLKETPFTPKVGLSFQATDKTLYYASIAKGYRIGGVNSPVPGFCNGDLNGLGLSATPPTYSADHTWSYELGTKNVVADGLIRYDASIYHIEWKKVQLLTPLNCGFAYTANAGSAVSNGFDLSIEVRPSSALTLGVAVGYTDAHYSKTSLSGTTLLVNNNSSVGSPLSGDVISPWSVSATAQYSLPFFEEYKPFIRAEYDYHSHNNGPFNSMNPSAAVYDPTIPADPATHLVKLRAGAEASGLQLTIFVDNLLNAHPQLGLQHNLLIDSPVYSASTFRPRTVGVTGIYRY